MKRRTPLRRKSKSERSKLIDKCDTLFSLIVRARDGWCCQYPGCGTYYEPPTLALHNSHFIGRANMGTRWDLDNCDALCYGHHRLVEGNKQGWYSAWKLQKLGKKRFDRMMAKGYSSFSIGVVELSLLLKRLQAYYEELTTKTHGT